MNKKIAVELVSKEYLLVDNKTPPVKIRATVYFTSIGEKHITLKTNREQDTFRFTHSEIEVAESVIGLMQKAVETAKKEAGK